MHANIILRATAERFVMDGKFYYPGVTGMEKSTRAIIVCVCTRLYMYTFHIVKRWKKRGGWVVHSRKESRKPSLLNTKEREYKHFEWRADIFS